MSIREGLAILMDRKGRRSAFLGLRMRFRSGRRTPHGMAECLFVLLNTVQPSVVFHVEMVQYCGEV